MPAFCNLGTMGWGGGSGGDMKDVCLRGVGARKAQSTKRGAGNGTTRTRLRQAVDKERMLTGLGADIESKDACFRGHTQDYRGWYICPECMESKLAEQVFGLGYAYGGAQNSRGLR